MPNFENTPNWLRQVVDPDYSNSVEGLRERAQRAEAKLDKPICVDDDGLVVTYRGRTYGLSFHTSNGEVVPDITELANDE